VNNLGEKEIFMNQYNFYATFSKGLQLAVKSELETFGADITNIMETSCDFTVSIDKISNILYNARTINKIVLILIPKCNCFNYENLYAIIKKYEWEKYFSEKESIRINFSGYKTELMHSHYAVQKIKDAVCDRFREIKNKRPNVELNNPDILIEARIIHHELEAGLSLKSQPLFKRGYRNETNAAPIKETLAAGLYHFIKPNNYKKIIDPMCGSGTIIIETALRLLKIPNLLNNKQSFIEKKLNIFPPKKHISESEYTFIAADKSYKFVNISKDNIQSAGLSKYIKPIKQNFFQPVIDMTNSLIIFNAPYGERLHKMSDINYFYKKIGDTMKNYCKNSTIYIFTNLGEHIKHIGLRTSKRTILYNGKIECRLLEYNIY
jgi:putative N6-adenine-specific DNA methylase